MKEAVALTFLGPGLPLDLVRRELPGKPGPGELLVEIRLATICGSDLHTFSGRRKQPCPCVPGHEGVGVVIDLGTGRDPGLLGRRVTWTLTDSCGSCPACLEWGLPQKCERLFKYGHASDFDGSGLNGCFASHIVLRPGTQIFEVPQNVGDPAAVSANCALATMVSVVDGLPSGCRTVVVQGAGMLGVHACALLRARGVGQVFVLDRLSNRLELASRFGAVGLDPEQALQQLRGRADAVIEVTGVSASIQPGLEMLRPGGFYAWVGMVHPESLMQLVGESIVRGCFTVRGFHNYKPSDLAKALEFLRDHGSLYPWNEILSPPFELSRATEAFELARSGIWPRVSIDPRIA